MVSAPRSDQLQLLRVAEYDGQIARLQREDEQHPLRKELAEIVNLIAAHARDIADNKEKLDQANRELEDISMRADRQAAIIREKKDLLQAGTGMDSRGLLTLQKEIDAQQSALDLLLEKEYQALEKVEKISDEDDFLDKNKRELHEKMLTIRANLEDTSADIRNKISHIQARRDELFAPLNEALKSEYERARARGGYAVIGLHPNGTSAGGIQLSPIEVSQIKKADPETVWISEDYECIVVLLDS